MSLAEYVLFQLAKALYHQSLISGHSSSMKTALGNMDTYDTYRFDEHGKILEAMKRFGVSITGKRVLDLGCNDGALSVAYLKAGANRVIGVDIDEYAIERARALHSDKGLGITFLVSKSNLIPLDDESVDVIIIYDVFEHISDPIMMLRELYRILVTKGQILIGTTSWYHPFAPHLWSVMPVPWAHLFFSERTLIRTCRRVYHSSWYIPNMYDFNENGERLPTKYTCEYISTDYLNKYLIRDFEHVFNMAGFVLKTYPVPFRSRLARWTRVFTKVPWVREFVSGYVWFVLTKPTASHPK